jgi:hypothetical protein
MTDDDITLPPPPSVAYIVTDPASTEYGLWRERNGPYDGNQMHAYARAAVLLDRQQRAASQGEAVAHVYDLGILARDRVLRENGPVNNAPLYLAPPAPSAEPVEVTVRNGRVWIKRGNQAWMLEYDDDENAEWYAQTLRDAICAPPAPSAEPPDHTALLRQALEALEERYIGALRDNALDALRAALGEK